MGVIPIVNENDTLAVSVGNPQVLETDEEAYNLTQWWIRKLNLATTIPFQRSQRPRSRLITSS